MLDEVGPLWAHTGVQLVDAASGHALLCQRLMAHAIKQAVGDFHDELFATGLPQGAHMMAGRHHRNIAGIGR
ncbi:hypothetical protein AFAE65S_04265 [Alcaligenes phenolicus]